MHLLNDTTKRQLDTFASNPSHALLLQGPIGSGTSQAYSYIIKKLTNPGTVIHTISPEKKSISIDQIRQNRQVVKHKSSANERIIVVLEQANSMTAEAQNALLKQLEEPISGVMYILLSEGNGLLPTIVSRAMTVHMLPVSQEAALGFSNSTTSSKNYTISDGLAGLYVELEEGKKSEYLEAIQQAKDMLAQTTYERFVMVETLTKSKADIPLFLSAMQKVCHAAVKQSPQSSRWQTNTRAVLTCQTYTEANVQSKLVLDLLVTSLV